MQHARVLSLRFSAALAALIGGTSCSPVAQCGAGTMIVDGVCVVAATDAGTHADTGAPVDAASTGSDAGTMDAASTGSDAGGDAGSDAGSTSVDAGTDSAMSDSGTGLTFTPSNFDPTTVNVVVV